MGSTGMKVKKTKQTNKQKNKVGKERSNVSAGNRNIYIKSNTNTMIKLTLGGCEGRERERNSGRSKN
jgi:hypothetical protein